MNRNILILTILIVISGVGLYGMKFNEQTVDINTEVMLRDTIIKDWQENMADSLGIPIPAMNMAINGYHALKSQDLLKNDSLLTIVDFSSPSTDQRFFVIDIKNQKVVKNTLVAHGMQSGVNIADSFSNRRHSNKSSLGLYLTQETYEGKHGYSLRLDGMSQGLNDNARKRAIVIHGADYVSEEFINQHGRIGRSFGCPAVPMDEVSEIIDLIKGGSCLFIYHPSIIPISQEDLERLP